MLQVSYVLTVRLHRIHKKLKIPPSSSFSSSSLKHTFRFKGENCKMRVSNSNYPIIFSPYAPVLQSCSPCRSLSVVFYISPSISSKLYPDSPPDLENVLINIFWLFKSEVPEELRALNMNQSSALLMSSSVMSQLTYLPARKANLLNGSALCLAREEHSYRSKSSDLSDLLCPVSLCKSLVSSAPLCLACRRADLQR